MIAESNDKLTEFRFNALEKGLEATNQNVRDFEKVARIQGESIAALSTKAETQNETIRKIMHNLQNTDAAVDKFVESSDIRLNKFAEKSENLVFETYQKLNERLVMLEEERLKKQGAHGVWNFIIEKFPAIFMFMVILFVAMNSIEWEKVNTQLDKVSQMVGK